MGVAVLDPPWGAEFSAANAGMEVGPSSVTIASIMAIAFRGASHFSKFSTIGPPSLILPIWVKVAGRRRASAMIGVKTAYPRKVAIGLLENECPIKKDSQPKLLCSRKH
jgi:hypothetical protein